MSWLFWTSVLLLGYVYVGYPVLIRFLGRWRSLPVRRAAIEPAVTVVIAAYNEEKGIAAKIASVLAQDYPAAQLQVLVASDASTDRTDAIVRASSAPNVALHRVEGRVGKTACQNSAVAAASGEIVVFTDATTQLEPQALRRLVENFADPSVGCVAGALRYVAPSHAGVAQAGVSYWDYELGLRRAESAACSLIGVSGCLYAVRRSAYVPIRADLISDFCIAMRMQEQGLRTVLDERAVCFEETLEQAPQELAMRVRVALRSLHALRSEACFLNPLRHGLFAWQLLSHKLLRYLSPLLWLLALAGNAVLTGPTGGALAPLYRVLLAGQLLLLALGIAGFWLRGLSKPHYFLLTNLASLLAWGRLLRGQNVVTWKPVR